MTVGHCHQTAQLFILYVNLFMYAMGFGIPSPIDVHSVCSNLDSIQQLHNHLTTAGSFCVHDIIQHRDPLEIKDAIGNELRGFYHAVKQATVTKRVDNAVAGILAEAAAGATGALISRKSTVGIVRETKIDSLETKMKSTGAFFGARIGMESICRILGIPKPLGLLLAAIVGSFVSTTVKAEGRMADKSSTYTFNPKVIHEAIAREVRFSDKSSAELITAREGRFFHSTNGESITNMDASVASSEPLRSWSPYFYGDGEFIVNMDPPRTAKVLMPRIKAGKSSISSDSMTFSEVAGDITKWMIFDSLSTNSEWTSRISALTLNDGSYMHVLSGSVAAVAGKYVQDLSTSRKCGLNSRRVPTPTSVRYAKTAFEGGVLFGTYKATLAFLNSVVPDDWNKEFLFQVVLENVEKTLPGL